MIGRRIHMKINEVARLTGVTVRTLHYYDQIGLLPPSSVTDSGYRIYDKEALETLQQILFFRELHFSLSDIKKMMSNPDYDKKEALRKQRTLLIQKRNQLDNLIALVDCTMKGDENMDLENFNMADVEKTKQKYAAEARERWGNTDAYKESQKKTSSYNAGKWSMIHEQSAAILKEFADCRHSSQPDSPEAQALVKKWQDYITENFYTCTNGILAGLGAMYVGDERFTQNLDQYGEGTAEFISKAIAAYCR